MQFLDAHQWCCLVEGVAVVAAVVGRAVVAAVVGSTVVAAASLGKRQCTVYRAVMMAVDKVVVVVVVVWVVAVDMTVVV